MHSGQRWAPKLQVFTINGADATGINFTATQLSTHTVQLAWQASTSPVTGYNIYRGTTNGGPYDKVNLSLITGQTYTDSMLAVATTYFYVTTAADA